MKSFLFSLALFCCFCSATAQTAAQNKAKVAEFYKAFNGDIAMFNAANFVAPDFVDHAMPPDAWAQMPGDGVARFQSAIQMFKASFPDSKFVPSIVVAEGEYVMAYGETMGTFKGDFMGLKHNDKMFKYNDVDIVKFNKEGKATAHWSVQDASVMWMQLGVSMK